jgi:hypothetical protein
MTRPVLLAVVLVMTGCTSNPYAPVNQITPIRQMDAFFTYWETPVYPVGNDHQARHGRPAGPDCCCRCD